MENSDLSLSGNSRSNAMLGERQYLCLRQIPMKFGYADTQQTQNDVQAMTLRFSLNEQNHMIQERTSQKG